jgi:hypothetical protein
MIFWRLSPVLSVYWTANRQAERQNILISFQYFSILESGETAK